MLNAYFVYTLLPLVLFMILKYSAYYTKQRQILLNIFVAIIFSLVLGLRYNVGVDYMAYLGRYTGVNIIDSRESVEIGYELLNNILQFLGAHYAWLFIIVCFLQLYPILLSMRRDSHALGVISIMMFLTSYVFFILNGMRQAIAFAFIWYGLQYILTKSFKKYLLCVLLATSFHKSAIIFIPFYFFLNRFRMLSPSIQLIILFSSFIYGSIIQVYLWDILPVFSEIILGQEVNDIQLLNFQHVGWNEDGRGYAAYMWLILNCIVIILYRKLKDFSIARNQMFDIYYNMYFIGTIMSNIVGSTYMSRLNVYFENYRIVIYAYLSLFLFYNLKKNMKLSHLAYFAFLWISLILFYYVAISKGAGLCAPYQFVFS